MKKGKGKKIFSISCIIISIVMVLFVVFSTNDLPKAWEAITSLDKKFFLLAIAFYCGFIFLEGLGLFLFLRTHSQKIHLSTAIHFSFVGMFYGNITPSSSGGQPMQVLMMNERGISVGTAVSGLTVRFVFNQVAVVLSTCLLWLTHRQFFEKQLGGVKGLVILGLAVAAIPVFLVLLVAYHRTFLNKVTDLLISFLSRHRLLKHPESVSLSIHTTLDNYQQSMLTITHRHVLLLFQFLISMMQYFCLMMVPVAIYYAMYQSGTSCGNLLTVSYALFSSASYTPLPGASGAQEGGFLVYFRGLFVGGTLPVALLVWRFITYYLSLIAGAADGIIRAFRHKHSHLEGTEQ